MSEYKEVRLKDITDLITKGTTPTTLGFDYVDVGVNFIKAESVTHQGIIDDSVFAKIPEEAHEKLSRSQLREDDILFSIAGVHLGKNAIVKEKYLPANTNQALAIIRLDKEKALPEYIHYYFLDPYQIRYINSLTAQSAQPNINLTDTGNLKVKLPALSKQEEIVSVLSDFDDLIENNTRRIAILEEMARLIYREWFVYYRYPGHEKDQLVDSGTELGEVPEGWEVKMLEDILEHYIGGGWGKEEQMEKFPDPAYVIRGTDIPGATNGEISDVPFRYHKVSNLKSRKLEGGDIVFEVSGGSKGQPLGRSLLITDTLLSEFDSEVMCASFCKLMRVNQEVTLPELLYLEILEMYDDRRIMKYQVQSTGISNFKFSFFLKDLDLLIPSRMLRGKFEKKVRPLLKEIHLLGKKNTRLKSTRDLLLPKLISGKIDKNQL